MSGFVGWIHTCIRLTRADHLFASLAGHRAYLRRLIPLTEHYASDDEVSVIRDGVAFSLNRSDYMQWHVFANLPEHSWRVALR